MTGMHRSGTSWVAGMVCAGGDFINIGEPLNCNNRQTILRSSVGRWYTYISEQNDGPYLPFYRDAVEFRLHPINDFKRMRTPMDPHRIGKRWVSFLLGRLQRRRVLFKDPFAVFSTAWFARRLECEIVVTVRHPAAVVSSLKRLGYTFDFHDLLDQPLLMRDARLDPFRPDMAAAISSPSDVIGQGSLLWTIVYGAVTKNRERDPRLHLVRHEDLSLNPVAEYERLYESLDLAFTPRARRIIERFTGDRNPNEVSVANPFEIRLDSRANLGNWRRRLNTTEIARIRALTEDVARHYYSDADWQT